MSIRRGDRDVELSALRDAFPDATARPAMFVHGLCETDDASKLRTDRHLPYGVRVRSELGYTPLYVRYNTGRHVSENGRELRQSLSRLRDPQPRP